MPAPHMMLSSHITVALHASTTILGRSLGFLPSDVSERSLQALLFAHVDMDCILLVGRSRSDEMLRFLHLQAQPIMHDLSCQMLAGGNYSLIPGQDIPNVLQENPNPVIPSGIPPLLPMACVADT